MRKCSNLHKVQLQLMGMWFCTNVLCIKTDTYKTIGEVCNMQTNKSCGLKRRQVYTKVLRPQPCHCQLLVSPCVLPSLVFPRLSLCRLVCVVVCDAGVAHPSWLPARPFPVTAHSTHLLSLRSRRPSTHQPSSVPTQALHPLIARSLFLTLWYSLALGRSLLV